MSPPATKPIAVVAGASSGVGLALTRILPALGYRVLGLGQRPFAKIVDCPFDSDSYCSCDLNETCAALLEVDSFLRKNNVTGIDLFIYCAGIGYYGEFEAQPSETIERITNVNVRTPILLTRALADRFNNSRLVYIASVAAFSPAPLYAVYSASKSFLASFANNLAIEERGKNKVQCVHLGPVRTDFHERSGVPEGKFATAQWDSAEQAAAKNNARHCFGSTRYRFWRGPPAFAMDRPEISRGIAYSKRAAILKHIVITGGANGIGSALVEAYCKGPPVAVTIIDRDAGAANMLCQTLSSGQTRVSFIKADFSASRSIPLIVSALTSLPPIDALVLNAGVNRVSPFFAGDMQSYNDIISVNFVSPMLLSHALLSSQMINGGGTVILVSSLSVFSSYPGAAVYAGSKEGLHTFANSLREITKAKNIKVLTVYPGPTETEQARSNSPLPNNGSRRMPPVVLAKKIMNAIDCESRWLTPGVGNICISLIGRVFPNMMQKLMRRVLFEKIAVR